MCIICQLIGCQYHKFYNLELLHSVSLITEYMKVRDGGTLVNLIQLIKLIEHGSKHLKGLVLNWFWNFWNCNEIPLKKRIYPKKFET